MRQAGICFHSKTRTKKPIQKFSTIQQARIQDFLKGGGGGDGHKVGGGVIGGDRPLSAKKLLFEHTKFSATRGGG